MNTTFRKIEQYGPKILRWMTIFSLVLTTLLPPPLITGMVTSMAPESFAPLVEQVTTEWAEALLPEPSVALAAPNLLLDKKVSNIAPAAGETFVYKIRYRCASLTEHCFNAQISDVVPGDLDIVSYSQVGGNVSAVNQAGNTVTWSLGSGNVPGRLDAGSAGLLRIRVRFPSCGTQSPAAGTTLSNVATFTEDSAGSVQSSATGADITVPTINACDGAAPANPPGFRKLANGNWVSPGDLEVAYTIDIPANPITSTGSYTVTDIFPAGYLLHTMSAGSILTTQGADVEVQCGGVWYTNPLSNSTLGDSNDLQGSAAANCTFEATPYDEDDEVVYTNMSAIRFIVPPGATGGRISMSFSLDANYPAGGDIRNTATLDEPPGTDIDNNGTAGEVLSSSDDRTVLDASLVTQMDKRAAVKPGYVDRNSNSILDGNGDLPTTVNSPIGGDFADLDLSTVYLAENDAVWAVEIGLNNSSSFGFDFVDPIIIDELPPEFDFVQDALTGNFVQSALEDSDYDNAHDPFFNPACHNPTVTVDEDFNGTQDRVTLSFPGCTLYSGGTDTVLAFYISGRLKPGTPAGTSVRNDVFITGSNGEQIRCSNSQPTVDTICDDSTSFTISTLVSVESSKYVQGALDSQFHRYPNAGYTNLDGDAVYELTIDNIGNVNYTSIDVVDILPYIGDTSLLDASARGSAWSEELATDIVIERYDPVTDLWSAVPAADLPLGTYYSSATNPCRLDTFGFELSVDEAQAVEPAGCTANPWTGASATTAVGARSFGFRFAPTVPLGPSGRLRIRVAVQQLAGEADAASGAIAWNSFAYGATYNDGTPTTLLATEPLKVGVEMLDTSATAALGDYVWFDSNNNGAQEVGEPVIAGMRVNLYAADGTTPILDNAGNPKTTTTDASGQYMFWGLTPNTTYVVRLDNASDYGITGALGGLMLTTADASGDDATDSDAVLDATDGYPEITATTGAAGTETRTYDFGFINPASVGNFVWDDLNADGIQDPGEPGFAGITVNLLDTTGATVATQVTDITGNYLFTNVVPGLYSIEFDPVSLPITRTFTAQGASGDTATDSDANASGKTTQFVLSAGEKDMTWDAGLIPPPTDPAAITGRAWEDLNDDGLDNNGEPGVPGMEVFLVDTLGLPVATATTDANGEYRFDNLTPGVTYQVVFNPDETQTVTTKQDVVGDDTIDSDASPTTGETPSVTPAANETIMNIDVGIISKLSLGNLVWYDNNDNGLVDVSEAGIPGVEVRLLDNTSTVIFTTTTDSIGKYVFTGLDAGSYQVEVVVPSGMRSSTDIGTTATPSPTDSDDNGQGIAGTGTVQSAVIALANSGGPTSEPDHGDPINGTLDTTPDAKAYYTVDFGFVQTVLIGNRIWIEDDGDGLAGTGLTVPIAGVTVTAVDASGQSYTATTDSNGFYTITVLAHATYTVTVPTPAGYTPSTVVKADADNNSVTDNNMNHNASGAVVVVNTSDNLTIDFAFYAVPEVTLEKRLNTAEPALVGAPISFTIRITNTGIVTITSLPLTDTYDLTYLAYDSINGSTPPSQDNSDDGQIEWPDLTDQLGDLGPGDAFDVIVNFSARADTTGAAAQAPCTNAGETCNLASTSVVPGTVITDTDDVRIQTEQKSSLGDWVWYDINANGLKDDGTTGINGVRINLYLDGLNGNPADGVLQAGEFVTYTVTANDTGDAGADTAVGEAGFYNFSISDNHVYIVEIDSTNFDPSGPLEGYTYTGDNGAGTLYNGPQPRPVNIGAGPVDEDNVDFPFWIESAEVDLSKVLNGANPVRTSTQISFTIRVTNTGSMTITSLPLTDTYNTAYLSFITASITPSDTANDGVLNWPDLTSSFGQDLAPNAFFDIVVEFIAVADTTALTNSETINIATAFTETAQAPVQIINPTAVNLTEQSVTVVGESVEVTWQTANESEIAGFYIHRQEPEGALIQLTEQPIVAQFAGQSLGAEYAYADESASSGDAYTYLLEMLSTDGTSSYVTLGAAQRGNFIFLPLVQR